MAHGNGFAGNGHAEEWDMTDRRASTFVQRWGGPIGTAGSILLSAFLLWHQMDITAKLQAAQIAALQAQVTAMQQQIDRMEGRIYTLTAAASSGRTTDQRQ